MIALEYNNRDIIQYGGNAFPMLTTGRKQDATVFDLICWKKSMQVFKFMSNEYDRCFHNWKLSGHHGEFPDDPDARPGTVKLPFEDFVAGNNSLLYMHEFVFAFPEVLATITGEFILCVYVY